MKKALYPAFVTLCVLITGCSNNTEHFGVTNYTYSYITSEVQEVTHDVYLAHCENNLYIEVPLDYKKDTVPVKYTGKIITYHVYDSDEKVSNGGYEYSK